MKTIQVAFSLKNLTFRTTVLFEMLACDWLVFSSIHFSSFSSPVTVSEGSPAKVDWVRTWPTTHKRLPLAKLVCSINDTHILVTAHNMYIYTQTKHLIGYNLSNPSAYDNGKS